jgi:hypothetical protein
MPAFCVYGSMRAIEWALHWAVLCLLGAPRTNYVRKMPAIMYAPAFSTLIFKLHLNCTNCGRSSVHLRFDGQRCICPCGTDLAMEIIQGK